MKLWKLDPEKANKILSDHEVKKALENKRNAAKNNNQHFLLLQEGLDKDSVSSSSTNNVDQMLKNSVDGILLGEELLMDKNKSSDLIASVKLFL
jgi:hypothetical protein